MVLAARAELELRRRRRARQIEAWRTDADALCASLGLTPDPWQRAVLADTEHSEVHLCTGRQVGKTETLGCLLLRSLLTPDALSLILSPSERQSRWSFARTLALWKRLGRPVPYTSVNLSSITLQNGSRLIALPGSEATIRGLANVNTLVIDEAAYVPDAVAMSIFPVLAVSGGRLVTASTPAGRRGWWFSRIEGRGAESLYVEVPSSQCPRIPAQFLASQQRIMGDWWFQQEYNCQFQEAASAAFREADIQAAVDSTLAYDHALFA